jgi:methyl-accepting chemotaxis protein
VLSDSAQRISIMLTQIEDLNASQERAIRGAVDSVASIEKGAGRLKEASATMHEMHAGIEELFTKLHKASTEHRQSMDTFISSGKDVATKMETTASSAGDLWKNYSSSFETLSEAIDGGIDRYTNGVSDSLERILGDFDQQLSRAVRHLDRILDQMRENFEELNEYMEELLEKAGK